MSISELYNDKVKFSLIPLTNLDGHSNLFSYIRHTRPDYMLEVSGLNIECKILPNNRHDVETIIFPEPLDCFFLLNYGDLFVCASNVIENVRFFEVCLVSLFMEAIEKRDECNKIISHAIHQSKDCTDIILRANSDYNKAFYALSFASLLSLLLLEDEKMEGLFAATVQEALTAQGLNYGAISPRQLQRNLDDHNLFSEITMTIRYRENGIEEFSFRSLFDLIGFEVHQLKDKNGCIKECENCGRLFIPANRSDEKYCDFIFEGHKTCKQTAFTARLNNNEALKIYRKIYKTQNARKQRNSHIKNISERFDRWRIFARGQLKLCQDGEITVSEMAEKISGDTWMSQG